MYVLLAFANEEVNKDLKFANEEVNKDLKCHSDDDVAFEVEMMMMMRRHPGVPRKVLLLGWKYFVGAVLMMKIMMMQCLLKLKL